MVKIYQQPFAHAGTKQAIPDASDPQGFVSNEDGFTTDYELPDTDPNYKPIERAEFNGLMNMVTEAVGELQQFGFAKWQAVDGGWPQGANVNHGGGVWQSLADANTDEPGPGALWKPILFDEVATTAQAQALINDSHALTPAKLAAAFGGANQGLASTGHQKLPGGLIIQWGAGKGSASGGVQITYPVAWPNTKVVLLASVSGSSAPGKLINFIASANPSASFNAHVFDTTGSRTPTIFEWFAVGY